MQGLFWRVFGAFWLANVSIILVLAWIASSNFESEKIPGLDITRMQATMDDQLRKAAREARRGGEARLNQALRISDSMGPITVYAIDSDGKDLLGRSYSNDVADALSSMRSDEPVSYERMRSAKIKLQDRNRELLLVATSEGSLFKKMLYKRPLGFWKHIGLALAASSLAAALVAWYVASPLARIRASTRRFAEGDLDARVGHLRLGKSTEINALATEFDRMAERIKALVENNRRLVRDVSHELRSPLARLRVALELARGQEGAALTKSLDRIERESDRLEAMLAQTIELSRLETRPELRSESIRLDELIESIIENADYEGSPLGRRVVLRESAKLETLGSRDALDSAVENIVRNAITYTTGAEPIEIRIDADPQTPQMARIRIRDHGPGVASEDLERIFEPFYRTDSARMRSSGGTGLGLAIARRAVVNMGGDVRARNIESGGLEVAILVPIISAA